MNIYIGEPVVISDMQGPAPDGFHVPLSTEWQAIYDAYTGLGLSGGANFATYLKLPMAGIRAYNTLSFSYRGDRGYYWSSTSKGEYYAYDLFFYSASINPQSSDSRSYGASIRCVKNSPIIPTSSWTTLYQGSGNAGIFHNPIDGLISLSSDGSTWYTLMDKNLGATIVYDYGDTLTESNCGKVYQRGNNYGFSGDANYDVSQISQSSTQVDVTGYGPGNYYESSTWITTNKRQSSANDGNNLRGGVTQGSGTKSTEVQNIYIGEYGWKPGENTLLYIPFTNNYNDYMGNTVTLNHGNAPTYSTTATGESYANISNTTLSTTLSSMDIGTWTVSQRIYNSQSYLEVIWFFGGASSDDSGYGTGMIISANNELIIFVYYGDINTGVVVPKNEWHNVIYTQGSGQTKVYLDGVLKYTTNKTYNKGTSKFSMFTNQYTYANNFAGKYDELIVENKTWTADEIAAYYNQTKSNYGL